MLFFPVSIKLNKLFSQHRRAALIGVFVVKTQRWASFLCKSSDTSEIHHTYTATGDQDQDARDVNKCVVV